MPFVSEVDRRSFMDRLQPAQYEEEATFGETFGAAFSLSVDEDLSISAALNNEMYRNREKVVRNLIDKGDVDRNQFTDSRGRFDYDRAAQQFPDQIRSDAELRTERNEILRLRREESQDVLERGSGLAQFLGTGSALILDPLNVATLGFGATVGATKGLTTIGRALYVARTEAAIAAATETAIQPLVFAHKNDIESPYAIEDALAAIGTAATFGAGLGFVAGGLGGYFRGARDKARQSVISQETSVDMRVPEIGQYVEAKFEVRSKLKERNDFVDDITTRRDLGEISKEQFDDLLENGDPIVQYKEAKARRDNLDRALDDALVQRFGDNPEEIQIAMDRIRNAEEIIEFRIETQRPDSNRIFDIEYQEYLADKTIGLEKTRDKTIFELEKEINKLEKKDRRLTTWVKDNGGLNKSAWGSEFGLEAAEMTPKAGWPPGFWRAGDQGMTPDGLIEALTGDPSLAFDFQYNQFGPQTKTQADAFAWFEPLISDKTISLYPELRAQIDDARRAIQDLQESPVDALEKLYQDAEVRVIEGDLETLAELNRTLDRMNQPTRVPEDYEPSPMAIQLEETNIEIRSTERQALNDQGLSEAHDVVMAEYRKLTPEERAITVEGEELSVDRLIEGYERDLNALDELLRCTRSA